MTQHDVLFRINTGDHKGTTYRYILAVENGAKMWGTTPLFRPPPSMIKEKIVMVIAIREKNISRGGAVELRMVQQIIDELSIIADETDVTLQGLDYQERPILIDHEGFALTTIVNEAMRSPEYRVAVTCWGLYE